MSILVLCKTHSLPSCNTTAPLSQCWCLCLSVGAVCPCVGCCWTRLVRVGHLVFETCCMYTSSGLTCTQCFVVQLRAAAVCPGAFYKIETVCKHKFGSGVYNHFVLLVQLRAAEHCCVLLEVQIRDGLYNYTMLFCINTSTALLHAAQLVYCSRLSDANNGIRVEVLQYIHTYGCCCTATCRFFTQLQLSWKTRTNHTHERRLVLLHMSPPC